MSDLSTLPVIEPFISGNRILLYIAHCVLGCDCYTAYHLDDAPRSLEWRLDTLAWELRWCALGSEPHEIADHNRQMLDNENPAAVVHPGSPHDECIRRRQADG